MRAQHSNSAQPTRPVAADSLWPRRQVLKALAAAGAGSAVFARALVAMGQEAGKVTTEMLRQAEWVAGVDYDEADRELMLDGVNEALEQYESMRAVELDNGIAPAQSFSVLPVERESAVYGGPGGAQPLESRVRRRPSADKDLAFLPVGALSALIRTRKVSSVELTKLYLERLRTFDPTLHCVITLTPELAMAAARRADRELAQGNYRGPLHGIPWGAKDLLAVPGYRTTWGAKPFENQTRPETATVAAKLEQAGAVLVAKLSVGALAWGDVWFGEKTRNPWKPEQGSSGSSAGPASATAAGLVGFSIGTETWGSIVSPSTRCGVTGLRPTFGRVSRYGAMALSWSMDKIGTITRSVEDCALVFDAIRGVDGRDTTVENRPFHWPPPRDPKRLRLGYVPELFEAAPETPGQAQQAQSEEEAGERRRQAEQKAFDLRTLATLRGIGFDLIPIELPKTYPVDALSIILTAEASTVFDDLTRSGRDDLMVRQVENAWPNVFRQGQLIPAVEYLRASRIRSLVMREMEDAMSGVDAFVAPTFGGGHLLLTNLTGHPSVVLPNGFRSDDGTPTSVTFTGRLFGETELLAVAHAYQQATGFHLKRPPVGG